MVGFLLVYCYCLIKLVFSGQIVSPVHVIFDLEGHKVCTLAVGLSLVWLWCVFLLFFLSLLALALFNLSELIPFYSVMLFECNWWSLVSLRGYLVLIYRLYSVHNSVSGHIYVTFSWFVIWYLIYHLYSGHNSVFNHMSHSLGSWFDIKLVCLPEVARVVLLLGCPFIRL